MAFARVPRCASWKERWQERRGHSEIIHKTGTPHNEPALCSRHGAGRLALCSVCGLQGRSKHRLGQTVAADTGEYSDTDVAKFMLAGSRFWLLWTLASAVGFGVGLTVGNPLGIAVGGANGLAIIGFVLGTVVGAFQWLVLRRMFSQAGWWIWATATGLSLGGAAALAMGDAVLGAEGTSLYPHVLFAMFGTVVGATVSILQWLVLRRWLSGVGTWIWVNILAWAVGFAVGQAVGSSVSKLASLPIGGATTGTIIGAITSVTLIWLQRKAS